MNKLTVWDDLFDIIPEDTNSLSDGECEWITALGCKCMPFSIINLLDKGEFDVETVSKHCVFSGFIGEIYCIFDFVNVNILKNVCDLRVADDFGNTFIYPMRDEVKQALYEM